MNEKWKLVPVELVAEIHNLMGDCHHDHHGYCQAHNLQPKGQCWVERLAAAPTAEQAAPQDRNVWQQVGPDEPVEQAAPQEPVAWAYYIPDGGPLLTVEPNQRSFKGYIDGKPLCEVPLYARPFDSKRAMELHDAAAQAFHAYRATAAGGPFLEKMEREAKDKADAARAALLDYLEGR